MRPPLCLQTLQLSITLQCSYGSRKSGPQVVRVEVLSRILLHGERVLVAVERRAQSECVQVARLLVHPVLGRARLNHEAVLAVTFSHLAHTTLRSQRQPRLVHFSVHILVELLVSLVEEVVREAILDKSVGDVGSLCQFSRRVDPLHRSGLLHQYHRIKGHPVLSEVDHSGSVLRVRDRCSYKRSFLTTTNQSVNQSTNQPINQSMFS